MRAPPASRCSSRFRKASRYPEGKQTWNPDVCNLNWDLGNGQSATATPGATILTLKVAVPETAVAKTKYPVEFVADKVFVSDKEQKLAEFDLINGSINILDVPPVKPGTLGFIIGNVEGDPGDTVKVPLTALTTDGLTEFSVQLDVPDGFDIGDLEFGPGFSEHGTFTWDPETKTLHWVSKDGTPYTPEAGELIANIPVTIPADAEPGTYPISVKDSSAKDADGNEMKTTSIPGAVNVNEPKVTTTTTTDTTPGPGQTTTTTTETTINVAPEVSVMTEYSIEFVEPGRKYYWSHDLRTFAEANGLLEMSTKITITKYCVNAAGQFVLADGTAAADKAAATISVKEVDVTAQTKLLDTAPQTPAALWEAEAAPHAHKYDLEFYLYPAESDDEDVKGINGGEALAVGKHQIFMGVKGDANLDDVVDTKDATAVDLYYNYKDVIELDEVYLYTDPELEGLAFFLADVNLHEGSYPDKFNWENPPHLDLRDSNGIKWYYNLKETEVILIDDVTWGMEEIPIGYDFPDVFYHGFENPKPNP